MIALPPGDPIPATALARALNVKSPALAKASREGRGPAGRMLVSGNLAVYPRADVEAWAREREAGAPARLEAARARAAHARAARAGKQKSAPATARPKESSDAARG